SSGLAGLTPSSGLVGLTPSSGLVGLTPSSGLAGLTPSSGLVWLGSPRALFQHGPAVLAEGADAITGRHNTQQPGRARHPGLFTHHTWANTACCHSPAPSTRAGLSCSAPWQAPAAGTEQMVGICQGDIKRFPCGVEPVVVISWFQSR
uniref:Uncharacterized protein n=1 Tax=Geospiza parvula TaxID=87175 RepID=A0A8U8B9Q2_GEOPR